MTRTLDQIHELYFLTKQEQDALSKRHAAEMEPLAKKLELLKAWTMKFLTDSGQQSAKTEHGTCFKSTVTSVTVDPEGGWDKLLDFIVLPGIARMADVLEKGGADEDAALAFRDGPEIMLLNRAVNKTAVFEILEQKGVQVPGVKIAQVVQVNIRKA
jgi:hypothetical protein